MKYMSVFCYPPLTNRKQIALFTPEAPQDHPEVSKPTVRQELKDIEMMLPDDCEVDAVTHHAHQTHQ